MARMKLLENGKYGARASHVRAAGGSSEGNYVHVKTKKVFGPKAFRMGVQAQGMYRHADDDPNFRELKEDQHIFLRGMSRERLPGGRVSTGRLVTFEEVWGCTATGSNGTLRCDAIATVDQHGDYTLKREPLKQNSDYLVVEYERGLRSRPSGRQSSVAAHENPKPIMSYEDWFAALNRATANRDRTSVKALKFIMALGAVAEPKPERGLKATGNPFGYFF